LYRERIGLLHPGGPLISSLSISPPIRMLHNTQEKRDLWRDTQSVNPSSVKLTGRVLFQYDSEDNLEANLQNIGDAIFNGRGRFSIFGFGSDIV